MLRGLVLVFGVAAASRGIHTLLPETAAATVSELLVAVLLGLLVSQFLAPGPAWQPGIRFAFQHLLRAAIVLLGLRFSLGQIVSLGGRAVGMIVLLMLLALAVTHLLGKRLGVPARLATLIGVGTAVCGNSAISATAPVIGARDEEVSYAIATNTLFGTLAVFAYPLLGAWFGFDAADFGTWAGTAVNDTSQVVATGFAHSEEAGRIATAVKLTRNALMGAVIVGAGFAHAERGASVPWGKRLRQSFPGFVLGFLFLAAINSFGWIEALSRASGVDIHSAARFAAKTLILLAMAGVGLGTRLRSLRELGGTALAMGLVAALAVSLASLLWIRWLGAVVG